MNEKKKMQSLTIARGERREGEESGGQEGRGRERQEGGGRKKEGEGGERRGGERRRVGNILLGVFKIILFR